MPNTINDQNEMEPTRANRADKSKLGQQNQDPRKKVLPNQDDVNEDENRDF